MLLRSLQLGLVLLLFLLSSPTAKTTTPGTDDSLLLDCTGEAITLSFYKSPRRACVKWLGAPTLGGLAATVAALAGWPGAVELKAESLWAKLQLWRGGIGRLTPLRLLSGARLRAAAKAGSKRLPLDTRFLEVLPRVGLEQLPLLLLQQQGMSRTIEGVKGALSESPGASPSWLRGPDGRAATLLQPSNALLQQLFQQQTYFRVEFKDAEKGSLKHFPINLFSAPRKDSSYFCGAKIPFRVSALGKQQLQQALLSGGPRGAPPEALMLAARASKDPLTEQDPTLVVVQWFRGPNGEALMRETTVHVEPEEAPVAPEGTPGRYGRRYISNFFADNSRLFSRFVGVVARMRLNRCFLWKFWASTNIDLEEAFSLLQLRPGSPRLFPTVDLFFSRPINYEVLRPIDSEAILVSPADSALQNAFYIKPDKDGNIVGARIPQIKGTTFNLSQFLFGRGTNMNLRLQSPKHRLHVHIFYLSPSDYHRFHSAADWRALRHVYMPGCLPSVRRTVLSKRDILDSFERTSVQGTWHPGNAGGPPLFFSMTFVAAQIVGGIELFYRKRVDQNRFLFTPHCGLVRHSYLYDYTSPVKLCMGQELGAFHFGSTVVLAYEAPEELETLNPICSQMVVNSPLGYLKGSTRRRLPRCDFSYGNHSDPIAYLQYLQRLSAKSISGEALLPEARPGPHTRGEGQQGLLLSGSHMGAPAPDSHSGSRGPRGDPQEGAAGIEEYSTDSPFAEQQDPPEDSAAAPLPSHSSDSQGPVGSTQTFAESAEEEFTGALGVTESESEGSSAGAAAGTGESKSEANSLDFIFTTSRSLQHQTKVTRGPGQEVPFSPLADLQAKVQALEFGLVHRFALAHWLAKAWTAFEAFEDAEGSRLVMLHVGQLGKNETDSNANNNPTCFYDRARESVQLRFVGQVSSLLLVWPAKNESEVLLRYPTFACASSKGWGKTTRGVGASWSFSDDYLFVKFQLELGRLVNEREGAVETKVFSFQADLEASSWPAVDAFAPEEAAGKAPVSSDLFAGDVNLLRFELQTGPTVAVVKAQRFAVTTAVPPEVKSGPSPNELICDEAPFQSALASLGSRIKALRWFRTASEKHE